MITINLMPAAMIAAQSRRRHLRRWGVSIAAAAVALFLALGNNWLQRHEIERFRNEEVGTLAELQAQREQLRSLTAESAQVLGHVQRADALRAKRAWSRLLGVVAMALPKASWISSLSTDPARPAGVAQRVVAVVDIKPGVAGSESMASKPVVAIEAPRRLRLTGYAVDAAEPYQFVANLKSAGVFSEISLIGAQREPMLDGSYFRFEVVCGW